VKCLFCNADKEINSDAEKIGYIMKRVHSITVDSGGLLGLQQDQESGKGN